MRMCWCVYFMLRSSVIFYAKAVLPYLSDPGRKSFGLFSKKIAIFYSLERADFSVYNVIFFLLFNSLVLMVK